MATTTNPTTSLTISFGLRNNAEKNGMLSGEVDSRADGLNKGNTTFLPGDAVYILVYKSDNVTLKSAIASAGIIALTSGLVEVEKTDDIQFANTNTASVNVPITSIVSAIWMGNNLGAITMVDQGNIKCGSTGVGFVRLTYKTNAMAYLLQSPTSVSGLSDFSILVCFEGELI